jgi:hypothetical protein
MPTSGLAETIRARAILRLSLGVTLAMAVAQGIGWPLAQMAPLLAALSLMSAPRAPTLAEGAKGVLVIVAATLVGFLIAGYLVPYPVTCVLVVVLLQFRIFHAAAGGAPPFVATIALIAVTLLPLLGQTSPGLAETVATGLVRAGIVAVLVQWVAFALIPPPAAAPVERATGGSAGPVSASAQLESAVRATAVVGPITMAFMVFNWNAPIVLIFAALLGQQPGTRAGIKGAQGLVVATVLGGGAAIVFYNLLVAVPSYVFLLVMTGLSALLFGVPIYAAGGKAPLIRSGFTTMLILTGSSVATFGQEADTSFYERLWQVTLAGLYIACAFHLFETFGRKTATAS